MLAWRFVAMAEIPTLGSKCQAWSAAHLVASLCKSAAIPGKLLAEGWWGTVWGFLQHSESLNVEFALRTELEGLLGVLELAGVVKVCCPDILHFEIKGGFQVL